VVIALAWRPGLVPLLRFAVVWGASGGVSDEAGPAALAVVALGVVLAVDAVAVLTVALAGVAVALAALAGLASAEVGVAGGALLEMGGCFEKWFLNVTFIFLPPPDHEFSAA